VLYSQHTATVAAPYRPGPAFKSSDHDPKNVLHQIILIKTKDHDPIILIKIRSPNPEKNPKA
jgi:hypothetical protein